MEFPIPPGEVPESPLSFYFEDVTFDLPDAPGLAKWLISIAVTEKMSISEVNVIFCSDEHLRGINVAYLDHDYYTDIITFPYEAGVVCGDIFISTDRVLDNAATQGVSFIEELCRVMAHGVLHLAGYEDKTPAKKLKMTEKEDFYLQSCPIFSVSG